VNVYTHAERVMAAEAGTGHRPPAHSPSAHSHGSA
jgi:hypothetical protein